MSAAEIKELVKPKQETSDSVHEWLRENDISDVSYSAAKDWITVRLPVEDVERLLEAEYYNFKHKDGQVLPRTTSWSLPRHLHDHIDTIQPTNSWFRAVPAKEDYLEIPAEVPQTYRKPSNGTVSQLCNVTSVTPACFAALYGTADYKPQSAGKNKIGFNNFLGEMPIRPDAKLFLTKYRPEAVSTAKDFKQFSIDGGPVQDGPLNATEAADDISKEANLDLQSIAGISWPTPIESFSTGGEPPFTPDLETPTNTNEPYLTWVNWVLNQDEIPQVISTSYGDSEQSVPRSYAERVCKQFAQVGARGTSLLFSSGDGGVGGNGGVCLSNDGKNTTEFLPLLPCRMPVRHCCWCNSELRA